MTNSTELSHMSKAVVSSRRTERRLIKGKSQPGRGMRVRIFVQGERRELNPTIQEQLFLIGREAVMNALRHSEATEIAVEVLGDRLRVSVRDNGRGIDPEAVQKKSDSHWGLRGMRDRAENIGARFEIRSRSAGGTELGIVVPIDLAGH